jgi:polyisoprenyl-teichoic acid--peptidoglycan teichoic acid transferase
MRQERYQPKKRKLWKKVVLLLFLLAGAAFAYVYFQYKQGVSQSIDKSPLKQEVYTFAGQKDQYGGTNILLLGSDARGEEKSRADTIMIAHYNEDKGTYKLTSIMRDTYVDIPGHDKNKINAAFAIGGPELMRKTIKENFDIDLQYYAIVDFEGFVQLIDEAFPEGVEVNVEKKMSEYIDVVLEPGLQKLDGEHLLGYVRFRHDAVGDFGRVKRQQEVVKVVGNQLASLGTIPKLPKLIGVVTPYVNTNIDTKDTLFMAKDFLSKDRGTIESFRIPVDNTYTDKRIEGKGAVLDPDLEENKEALHQFIQQ